MFEKAKLSKSNYNENCRVNNLAACPLKTGHKNVARLLTLRWPGYWPYFFEQKAENLVFKILKKPILEYFGDQTGKQKLDSPKKQ